MLCKWFTAMRIEGKPVTWPMITEKGVTLKMEIKLSVKRSFQSTTLIMLDPKPV